MKWRAVEKRRLERRKVRKRKRENREGVSLGVGVKNEKRVSLERE